jgi:cytochrome c553
MPKHIFRLMVVIVACATGAVVAKAYFTKDSFYRYGHYRADSVAEIAALTPAYQTPRACESCHGLRHAQWKDHAHRTVICETCHGAAPGHPDTAKVSIPAQTNRLCSQCHEQMPGRPMSSIRQVGPAHPQSPQCISCHDPHAPKIEAQVAAGAGARAAGQAASATCAGCHGAVGQSVNPEWPNLAGQNAAYLARSMASFQIGARKSDLMGPIGQSLAPADIPALAAYFSSQSCKVAAPPSAARFAAGERVAVSCAACHGDHGRGTSNASLPRLSGQNAAYLSNALKQFKTEERTGPIMVGVARELADADIAAVSDYYASQSCGARTR